MKKRILTALLVAAMVLSLVACGKKTLISISFGNIGDYDIVQVPKGFENLGMVDNVLKMTVKKDGEYPFVIKTTDGTEYSFVVKYEKGATTVETEDDLEYMVGVE